MTLHFHILGVIFIALALLHIGFPRYFRWKEEFTAISLINRQMMYVHAAFIAIVVFGIGLLCLTSASELIGTPLGRRLCFLLSLFWLLRLITQFFGYSARLWRGKPFETMMHGVFSAFWAYATAVFGLGAMA
jgi:hypothetical protein